MHKIKEVNWQRAAFWSTVLNVPDPRHIVPVTPPRLPRRRNATLRCELCRSSFGQRGDLMRHVRVTHLGERNYHCAICGSSFGRRSVLNKHQKRHQREISAHRAATAAAAAAAAIGPGLHPPHTTAASDIVAFIRSTM